MSYRAIASCSLIVAAVALAQYSSDDEPDVSTPDGAYRSYFGNRAWLTRDVSTDSPLFDQLLTDPSLALDGSVLAPPKSLQTLENSYFYSRWSAANEGRLDDVVVVWTGSDVALVRAVPRPSDQAFLVSAPRLAVLIRAPDPWPGSSVGSIRVEGEPLRRRQPQARWQVALDTPASHDELLILAAPRRALSEHESSSFTARCVHEVKKWLSGAPATNDGDVKRTVDGLVKTSIAASTDLGTVMIVQFDEAWHREGVSSFSLKETFLLITFAKPTSSECVTSSVRRVL